MYTTCDLILFDIVFMKQKDTNFAMRGVNYYACITCFKIMRASAKK
jgi:hypothetical protein